MPATLAMPDIANGASSRLRVGCGSANMWLGRMGAESLDEQVAKAARAYSAAADHYSRPALGFWDRFGAATVERVRLAPGQAVLDLCCGAGASAIPAARAVGPLGRVLGVDVAAPLLESARARAAAEGLGNIAFRHGDARSTRLPSASFDCVICVFGVFFASDMPAFMAEMWRLVRPSGRLAVTTWGPGLFEPANSIFWDAVRGLQPGLCKAFNPWDEITTPTALRSLCERAGIESAVCEAVAGQHRLAGPEDFWDVVLGSGYRATVESLAADKREALREHVLAAVRDQAVTVLRTDVVYGIAERG